MRPCTATADAPAASTLRASSGAFTRRSFHPARIFTVTGIFTAFTIAATMAAACSGSFIRLQPALCFAIFGTGQPMLTSTTSAPRDSTMAAADAMCSGVAAEELDGDRPLFVRVVEVLERPIDAAHEALRRHHLRHDQAAAALPLHEAAERAVGHAGHGRDAHRGLRA